MSDKRTLVVFSDIEMGAGGALDDFPHSAFLGDLLLDYTKGRYADHPVEMIFNGDCFDFLKTGVDGKWPYHIDKAVALHKLDAILAAHAPLLDAIDSFVERGAGKNRVHFVVGNHDAELLFPAVQRALRDACGGHEQVLFPGFDLTIGPVHFEHGHQYDSMFRMDPARPFIDRASGPLLNLSWASIGLLCIVMQMHPDLYFYDRLLPRKVLFELFPEMRELFVALSWRYWTKDFWRGFLIQKDPLLRFDWTTAKEVIKRIALGNTEIAIDSHALNERVEGSAYDLHVSGHLHELKVHHLGTKRIVQSGAMRDEYFIQDGGTRFEPTLKCFVEIALDDERVVGVTTRELLGPPRPTEHMLEDVREMVPFVRSQLDFLGDTKRQVAASQKQERIEAAEAKKRR